MDSSATLFSVNASYHKFCLSFVLYCTVLFECGRQCYDTNVSSIYLQITFILLCIYVFCGKKQILYCEWFSEFGHLYSTLASIIIMSIYWVYSTKFADVCIQWQLNVIITNSRNPSTIHLWPNFGKSPLWAHLK